MVYLRGERGGEEGKRIKEELDLIAEEKEEGKKEKKERRKTLVLVRE